MIIKLFYFKQKYGLHSLNYLLIKAKKDKVDIKKIESLGKEKKKMCRRFSEKKLDIKFNSYIFKNLKFKNEPNSTDEKNNNIQKENGKKYKFKKKLRNNSEIIENRKISDILENKLNLIDTNKYKLNRIKLENYKYINNIENQNKQSKEFIKSNIEKNKIEDQRLNYVLKKLGLEKIINVFVNNFLTFNDILFLTRDNLNEFGLLIFQKIRLFSFIEDYKSFAKSFSIDEIKSFFKINKKYNISKD